jgi:hypothetical protein
MVNMRQYVEPPAFTSIQFGLLTSIAEQIRTPSDPHWQQGVTYESLCGPANTTFDDCIAVTGASFGTPVPPSPPKADTGAGLYPRGATAFTVYTEIDCSAPGFWERSQEAVNENLTRREQFQVEQSFWTGLAGGQQVVFPHLQANTQILDENGIILQTAATSVSGAAQFDLVEGLGRLEAQLEACYDGVGVIHVPAILGAAMANNMLLVREGPRYRTPNGNIVVIGAGYPGTGPSDAPNAPTPSNNAWIYATGAMMIYRSPVTIMPRVSTLNKAENTMTAIAERTYSIAWDCCHYAVNVTLGGYAAGISGSAT